MSGARVLVVEDEEHLAAGLRFNLEAEGYTVETVGDGEAALGLLLGGATDFDVVMLDVMLPGKDGFEAGADDYLPKPFELAILLARLNGLLRRREWLGRDRRRQANAEAEQYSFDGKTVDFGALELRAGGRVVRLTLMEAELLRYLIVNSGRAVSRREILEEVWNLHEDTDTRAIDNFVVRLRRYVEDDPSDPKHLLTVRGVGYRFVPAPSS